MLDAYGIPSICTFHKLRHQNGASARRSAMSSAKRQCPTEGGEPGERQPVVLVDMDGTIADFDGRVYALMAASHPDVTPPRPIPGASPP